METDATQFCSGLIIDKRISMMKNEVAKHYYGPRRCNSGLEEGQPT